MQEWAKFYFSNARSAARAPPRNFFFLGGGADS